MADDETAPTEFEITSTIGLKFSAAEVVADLGHERTVQLIKELDMALEDWGVTEELHDHFSLLMKEYDKEEATP